MNDHRRRNSLRYPGYDYSQEGAVAVTICTHNRQRLFGEIITGEMNHSPAGLQATTRWMAIPSRFPGVMIDALIIMPDHLHGIIFTGTDPAIPDRPTIGDIVRWFKSALYSDYGKGVRLQGWPPYDGRLWQDDYYDHIIRNDHDLDRTRAYIEANPARWQMKTDNAS